MKNEIRNINQSVLEGKVDTPEFFGQIQRMAASIINKRYGRGVWHQATLSQELLSAAMIGTCSALKKYNAEKGEFLSYARIFMFGEMHIVYCQHVFGLTPYYASMRKHVLDSLAIYYENHDLNILYDNIRHFHIAKSTICTLYSKNKLDLDKANICISVIEQFKKSGLH